jgi:hypothetical protein
MATWMKKSLNIPGKLTKYGMLVILGTQPSLMRFQKQAKSEQYMEILTVNC